MPLTRRFPKATHGTREMTAYVASERAVLNNPDVCLLDFGGDDWIVSYGRVEDVAGPCGYCGERLGQDYEQDDWLSGWSLRHGFCSESCEDQSAHFRHQQAGVDHDEYCIVCAEEAR